MQLTQRHRELIASILQAVGKIDRGEVGPDWTQESAEDQLIKADDDLWDLVRENWPA